jgi:hypothetical protein
MENDEASVPMLQATLPPFDTIYWVRKGGAVHARTYVLQGDFGSIIHEAMPLLLRLSTACY